MQVYLQKIIHSASICSIYPLEITEFTSTDLPGYLSRRIHGLEVALDGFTIQRIVSVVVNGAVLCRNQAQDGSTMFTLSALCLTCLWPALNSGDNVVERHMGE